MTMTERATVVGVFASKVQAEKAIEDLHRAGLNDNQIGFVARHAEPEGVHTIAGEPENVDTAGGAMAGALGGGVLGGIVGAAAALLIPGLGPAVAGGILGATIGGAALGATAGGLIGALTALGIPEEEARYYQNELGAGRVIVTVNAPGRYQEIMDILHRNGAYDASTQQQVAPASTLNTTNAYNPTLDASTAAAPAPTYTPPTSGEEERPLKPVDRVTPGGTYSPETPAEPSFKNTVADEETPRPIDNPDSLAHNEDAEFCANRHNIPGGTQM